MVGSVNRQTGYRDPASVSIANMETTNDQRRSSGFRDALCSGLGGAGRQRVSRTLASPRMATQPLVNRPVAGNELARLLEVQTAAAPDFVWQLLDWTSRGDVVIIEWQTTRNINGQRFSWRGVDKFRIKAGKIIEERVYTDTAPLRAARSGTALEPITRF